MGEEGGTGHPTEREHAEATELTPHRDGPRTDRPSADRPSRPSPDRHPSTSPSTEERATLTERATRAVETLLLGAIADDDSAIANVVRNGGPPTSQRDLFAAMDDAADSSTPAGQLGPADGPADSGEADLLGLLRPSTATRPAPTSEGRPVTERTITARIRFEPSAEVGGSGAFDPNEAAAQIRARASAIRRCYETELTRNPTLEGKVTVELTFEPRGTVTTPRVVENQTNEAVARCLTGVLSRLRLREGPTGGQVVVRYPFVFARQE